MLPLGMLYLGKLIIDEVVFLTSATEPYYERVGILVLIELGLAASTDLIGRGIAVADSLLGDLVSHDISLRLMDHATKLDIAHFEDAEFYDKLERARRQASNRILLMSQSLNQIQDLMTVGTLSLALIAFNPWILMLLAVALIPAFLGETHFTGQSYSLMYGWTEERRELDYLRYAGASDETAKEVKIFGLADFLKDRYRKLAWDYYSANRSLTLRRAAWGGGLSLLGSIGYYTAFAFIIFQTVHGQLSLGDLTFLSGSFMRMRTLMESVLNRFSSIAESALHLRDLFDFFNLQPNIRSKSGALPFPNPVREGFVFENVSFHYPNSDQSVLRNVSFGLNSLPTDSRDVMAKEALARVGMLDAAGFYPHMLSGGEQQRVALARAAAPSPGVMLLDEPFSGLDTELRASLRQDTLRLIKETGATTLMVTHDPVEAMLVADHLALMNGGRVVQAGLPMDLYRQPKTPFCARFLGEGIEYIGFVRSGKVITPLGSVPAENAKEGDEVVVLVRPEALNLRPESEGQGIIATVGDRRDLGLQTKLELRLESDDEPVHVNLLAQDLPLTGSKVAVFLDFAMVFVFPVRDR